MKYFLIGLMLIVSVFAQSIDDEYITLNLINQDPDPASAGEIVEVRIGIANSGETSAENLVIEVSPDYPFSLVPGEDALREIDTVSALQTGDNQMIIKYKILTDKDVTEGTYDLDFLQYEEGKKSQAVTKSVSIDISSQESAEIVFIDKSELIPGKETELTFTIHNVGSAPLEDLFFSWTNEDDVVLPVGSDDTKYIKYLEVDEKLEVSYNVIADTNADPGLYKLDLSLIYGTEQTEISTNAGVYVGGATDFDIAFSDNSDGEYSFTVANIGSNPAYSVSVSVPEQEGWTTNGATSSIIGNLNNGDYTIVSFELTGRNQETIELKISYTDTKGERISVIKEATVKQTTTAIMSENGTEIVEGQRGPGGMGGTGNAVSKIVTYAKYAGVLLLVLIFGYVGYRIFRKKRK